MEALVNLEVLHGDAGEAVHKEILRRVAAGFSGAVVVEQDGSLALKAGYGWANRERRIPFIPSTIAQIGSLTKGFTAAAVVHLALQGQVDFLDPLSKYLPGLLQGAPGITLHQLLTHTAGLPDSCCDDFDRLSRDEIIARCLAGLDLSRAGAFAYSNLGYSLLAALLEGVSGMPYEDFLARKFFENLGMARTGYFFEHERQDQLAWGYTGACAHPPISAQLQPLDPDFWNLKGNGGMQASAEDMYAWYRGFAHGPGLYDSMRHAMLGPHVDAGDGVAYGYGWFVRANVDGQVEQASHTGGDGSSSRRSPGGLWTGSSSTWSATSATTPERRRPARCCGSCASRPTDFDIGYTYHWCDSRKRGVVRVSSIPPCPGGKAHLRRPNAETSPLPSLQTPLATMLNRAMMQSRGGLTR